MSVWVDAPFWVTVVTSEEASGGVDLWGDVSSWVGAVGTVGALLWAVYVYKGSIADKEIAQARLLSIARRPVRILQSAGTVVTSEFSHHHPGIGTARPRTDGQGWEVVTAVESIVLYFRLISTSDETFTVKSVDVLRDDGTEFPYPNLRVDISPREDFEMEAYFPPDLVGAADNYRVRFLDASGRHWERINGQPVRKYKPEPEEKRSLRRLFRK